MAKKDFHHPFEPYDIQLQFMTAMYECIEQGGVGIFESPTGTGKSLSLICSSLIWLREHKRRLFDEASATVEHDDDEPDWMSEHAKASRQHEMRQMREDFEARLDVAREKERKLSERAAGSSSTNKRRKLAADQYVTTSDEDYFLLDDYESDDDRQAASVQQSGYSAETSKLMERLGIMHRGNQEGETSEGVEELQVFFCSRTHSQLSQFVGELQRVHLPPGMPPESDDKSEEPLKHVSLGSRKNLCINPKVAKLHSQTAVNERCVELQQSSTPADQKCPFLPGKESGDLVLDFRDHALAQIRDIEDLANLGSRLGICPYYASRSAIAPAEIVTLPYPLLLQKTARDALGISLKGHIVVIDEAHNLMDAIEGIYSVAVSSAQLQRARQALLAYLQKFRNRLKGSNRVYVTQVVRVIDSMLQYVHEVDAMANTGGTFQPSQLLAGKGVDQINLTKLIRYIGDSKLARKVEAYIAHVAPSEKNSAALAKSYDGDVNVPSLTSIQNFLATVMNPSNEGNFFWNKEHGACTLRYMLLDPSEHFREIVEDARAVILAGGTMSPMDDYRQRLFPYLPSLKIFSCGHLIPPSSLLVRAVASDEVGPLEFSFKARSNETARRIGQALLRIAPQVQGGLVVFLPSYAMLKQLAAAWNSESITADLAKIKPVFWDSQTGSAENTFKEYSKAIATSRHGAIMLSVIGGKLSEGINFADDLGRCVVVVGLPFPNLQTAEWKARLQYIDEKAVARGEVSGKAGREHAENVCMRAVNQAVGRVIRHKNDWASIILMDSRYNQTRIRGKLPGWIKKSFADNSASDLAHVVEDLAIFNRGRRSA
ncbi:ATP-dependent DNA helicase chl1 [Recurvomyces mirabilis]|nr:ATP-dependent DNA helicase chl1 [Recurvomyces mirabilis]